jgi:alpha-galactosidase
MGKASGRVTMTAEYAKELLRRHPDWIIKDGQIGHPDDFEKKS